MHFKTGLRRDFRHSDRVADIAARDSIRGSSRRRDGLCRRYKPDKVTIVFIREPPPLSGRSSTEVTPGSI